MEYTKNQRGCHGVHNCGTSWERSICPLKLVDQSMKTVQQYLSPGLPSSPSTMLSLQPELPQAESEEPRGSKTVETSFHGNSDCSPGDNGESLKHGSMEGIPEAAFELSLRDLVELPKIVSSMEKQIGKGGGDLLWHKSRNWERMKIVEVAKEKNSGSVDVRVGLFKWLFPAYFGLGGSRRRANGRTEKGIDGEQFRNINLGELKRNHNAETDDNMSRRMGGCSPFFNTRKTRARKKN